jgi:formate dehydrogenase maturation protein FdhE
MVYGKYTVTVLCNCGHVLTVIRPVSIEELAAIKAGPCPDCTHPYLKQQ